MKTTTKLASYLLATAVMAVSPFTAFATESAGTNGMTFYDYLASNADKDTVIDFNQAPATGNVVDEATGAVMSDIGGLYMLQDTKNDAKPMYFYRGNVENNNVILNDFCWLIVRTTETGGTKLLYNGTPTDGQCLGDPDWTVDKTIAAMNQMYSGSLTEWPKTNIGASQFNAGYNSPSDMYYMYGERYESTEKNFTNTTIFGNDVSYANGTYTLQDTVTGGQSAYNGHHYTCLTTGTTCSEVYYENLRYDATDTGGYFLTFSDGDTIETALSKMAENKHDSIAKTTIENWYADHMTGVTDYLEDTVWYGDKTYASGALATKDADFSSNFDKRGTSYTTTTVNVFFHGASREDDSAITVDTAMSDVSFDYTDPDSIYTVANGTLKYPVGLLTSSEMIMAGNGFTAAAKGAYIDDNFIWWGVSPFDSYGDGAVAGAFAGYGGYAYGAAAYLAIGLRPSVSLKSTLGALDGDGSPENPLRNLVEMSADEDDDSSEDSAETPAEDEVTPTNPQTLDPILHPLITLTALGLTILASKQLALKGRK